MQKINVFQLQRKDHNMNYQICTRSSNPYDELYNKTGFLNPEQPKNTFLSWLKNLYEKINLIEKFSLNQ